MHIRTNLPDIDIQLGKFDLISERAKFGGAKFAERFHVEGQVMSAATYLVVEA